METAENTTSEVETVLNPVKSEEISKKTVDQIAPASLKRPHPSDENAGGQIVKKTKVVDDKPIKAVLVNECGLITPDQYKLLQKYLFRCVLESLSDTNVPRIDGTTLQEGVVKVSCLDQVTFDWVKHVIHKSEALWPRMRLRVLSCDHFNMFRALIYVRITLPGEVLPPETVFRILSRQNPRLNTSHWQFCSAKPSSNGQTICIRMDILSVRELARNHRLLYGIGPVYAQLSNTARKLRQQTLSWMN